MYTSLGKKNGGKLMLALAFVWWTSLESVAALAAGIDSLELASLADVSSSLGMLKCNHRKVKGEEDSPPVLDYNITFAQYNVWNYDDGPNWRKKRLMEVTRILRDASPHVIGLNEIRAHSTKGSMFSDFCLAFPQYYGYFQPAMRYEDGTVEGVALFSKFRITRAISKHLHNRGQLIADHNRRVILGANIGRQVHIFVSHFSFQAELRMQNVLSATKFIRSFGRGANFLLADTNANTESDPAIISLKLRLGLIDAHKDTMTSTYCNCGHNRCELNKRPDQIFLPRRLSKTLGKAWVGPPASSNNCPSDHRAVFIKMISKKS